MKGRICTRNPCFGALHARHRHGQWPKAHFDKHVQQQRQPLAAAQRRTIMLPAAGDLAQEPPPAATAAAAAAELSSNTHLSPVHSKG